MAIQTVCLYLSAPGYELTAERRLFAETIVPRLRTRARGIGVYIDDVTPADDVGISERLKVLQRHRPLVVFFVDRSGGAGETLTVEHTEMFPVLATLSGMSSQEMEFALAVDRGTERIHCYLSRSALDSEPDMVDRARTLHRLLADGYVVDRRQPIPELILPGLAQQVVDDLYSSIEAGSVIEPRDKALPFHEDVQFTAYRPRIALIGQWSTVLAFAHLGTAPPGTDPSDDPIRQVERRARAILGDRVDDYSSVRQESSMGLPEESEVTFVLELPGFDIRAPRRTFLWVNAVHQEEFAVRPHAALLGTTVRGSLTVYHGAILLADVRLSVRVDVQAPAEATPLQPVTAMPYRRIFPSYSHLDVAIVEQFEAYAEACGDRYLRDVRVLRAGENWNERLLEFIHKADVFQLFWSNNSMHSPFVEQEWRYALKLNRPSFVRPTYWEDPMPTGPGLPPQDLQRLHFHLILRTGSKDSWQGQGVATEPRLRYDSQPGEHAAHAASGYGRTRHEQIRPAPPGDSSRPPALPPAMSPPDDPPTMSSSTPGAVRHARSRSVWPWVFLVIIAIFVVIAVVVLS